MTVNPLTFFSNALYSRKTCYIYLPPNYDQSEGRYPVIYLLHGSHGSELNWIELGKAAETLDRLIGASELRECIVVMPNDGGYAQGTYYANWYDGSGAFEHYIIDDLVPQIDAAYRTIPIKNMRSVAGLSMGGYGAVMLALRNPDVFGAAASLSGALSSFGRMNKEEFDRLNFPQIFGPHRGSYVNQYDLHVLAAHRLDDERTEPPGIYINCGINDHLYHFNVEFHNYLSEINYDHEYAEFPGGHTWDYWIEHLSDVLLFFERSFYTKTGCQ